MAAILRQIGPLLGVILVGGCHWVLPFTGANDSAARTDGRSDSGRDHIRDDLGSLDLLPDGLPSSGLHVNIAWEGQVPGTEVRASMRMGENAFAHIQEAVDVAGEGTTIHVEAGTYCEPVKVTGKIGLHLRGWSDPVIKGDCLDRPVLPADQDIVAVKEAQDITIEGFTIEGSEAGVYVENSTRVTVRRNRIHKIRNNPSSIRGVGILVWQNCHNNLIVDNLVEGTDRQGIFVGTDGATRLDGNHIIGNRIRESGRNQQTLEGRAAVQLDTSDNSIVRGNDLSLAPTGVLLKQCQGIQLVQNTITKTNEGVFIATSAGIRLDDNDLAGNFYGLMVKSTSDGLSLQASNNRFCGNASAAVTNNSATTEVVAQGCWWGSASGPRRTGEPGDGQLIEGKVDASNHQEVKPSIGPCAQ